MSAAASPAERAAVDALLGPPPIADGAAGPGRSERGRPQQAREERRLLLPALHAVQDAIGWISAGALGYVCERLRVPPAEAYGVAESYALLSTRERPPRVAHICDDIVCRNAGADALAEEVGRALEGDEGATWEPSPCLGVCERAPAALLQIAAGEDSVLAPAGMRPPCSRGCAARPRTVRATALTRPPRPRRPPSHVRTGCDCCAGRASWTPRASRTTARTAATRRCESRWSAGRRG